VPLYSILTISLSTSQLMYLANIVKQGDTEIPGVITKFNIESLATLCLSKLLGATINFTDN